ncbi:MAG: alanine--tRNA ligase [Candidatus Margulisbacteria bacterium]|nr:alanine--tRNA ligase [Candidatus Margulisiibacteriota bacterium]
MKSSEIRKLFLKYFESNGHAVLSGSSLVPSDPTVLLTLAGMLQFKPIFLGKEKSQYKRVCTAQKCMRMNDIDRVGRTPRHHTFFEMLGNFSFGDYFKKEAIWFAWELLTSEFKIPPEKLFIAVFEKDNEAYEIWEKEMGLPKGKIFKLGEDNNFWAAGPTGPCGPCSEIYYDFGARHGCGKPNCQPGCDCERFLEIWNLVFIQYDRNEKGELLPLKQKGIDTGMGIERIASVLQEVDSNFETDLFVPLIQRINALAKVSLPAPLSVRIIADHIRAIAHLISDAVFPENMGRGYVLRRLIRRAVRHGLLIGIKEPFLGRLSQEVIDDMKDAYPVLAQKQKIIYQVILSEEEAFLATLEQGMQLFKEITKQHIVDKVIPGEIVFKLHDTYGFPAEVTKEMAIEMGFIVDEKGFGEQMEGQRERARKAGISSERKTAAALDLNDLSPTEFLGYEKNSIEAKIIEIFPKEKCVVLDKTPFYAESGGQIGDTGIMAVGERQVRVIDTMPGNKGVIVHKLETTEGLQKDHKVRCTIDISKRRATEAHHTATHLLHKALREVVGDQIKQAGSYVGPDKLRFDFNHFSALKPEQITRLEMLVNAKIHEKIKVEVLKKSLKEALQMGATALFGEKYGENVRLIKIDDYSLELCGGTHVKSTGDILYFKILSESALGAGIRRIEAVAGQTAKVSIMYQAKSLRDKVGSLIKTYHLLQLENEKLGGSKTLDTGIFEIDVTEIERLGSAVDNQDSVNVAKFLEHLAGRVEWLEERIAKTQKEINNLKMKQSAKEAVNFASEAIDVNGAKVLIKKVEGQGINNLRVISDTLQQQLKSCVLVLFSVLPDKVMFLAAVTPDLISKGYSAKTIADSFSPIIGGKGGGKDTKVEGGGKEIGRVEEAMAKVREALTRS